MPVGIILVCTALFAALVFIYLGWFAPEKVEDFTPEENRWKKNLYERIGVWLRRAGYLDMTPGFFLMVLAVITVAVALTVIFLTRQVLAGAIALPVVAFIAYLFLTSKERSYLKRASLEMVPFLTRVRAAIGAGSSAQRAFLDSVEGTKLIRFALRDEIRDLYLNVPLTEVLVNSLDKLPIRSWEQFVRQLTMTLEKGGDLEEALGNSVTQINNLMQLQAELRADYSRAQREQVVIIIFCVGILAVLGIFMGELLKPLFTEPFGLVGLFLGVSLMLAGIAFGQKNVRDIERKLDF